MIGYCNATDDTNIKYEWVWSKDGVFYSSGNVTDYTYQETAQSLTHVGKWLNDYPGENLYDGNFSSYAYVNFALGNSSAYGYFNYVPLQNSMGQFWLVKYNIAVLSNKAFMIRFI